MNPSSRKFRVHRALTVVVCICTGVILTSCLTPLDMAPVDILDETTGNTYTTVAQPLIFARLRTDVAANARDYATLAAADINRAGKLTTYLLAWRWATVDVRMSALPGATQGRLRFVADGRAIELQPETDPQTTAMLRTELAAPRTSVKVGWVYSIDAATLRYLAESRELQLQFPDEAMAQPFEIWTDGRKALLAFAQQSAP